MRPLSTGNRRWLQSANAQVIVQLLQPSIVTTNEELNLSFDRCYSRIIMIRQGLNLISERLNLAFVRIELRREDMNLVAENLDS